MVLLSRAFPILLLLLESIAALEPSIPAVYRVTHPTNVLFQAENSACSIEHLKVGTPVWVVAELRGWYQVISLNCDVGYVLKEFAKPDESAPSLKEYFDAKCITAIMLAKR